MSTPFAASAMSGNFDFPPATNGQASNRSSTEEARQTVIDTSTTRNLIQQRSIHQRMAEFQRLRDRTDAATHIVQRMRENTDYIQGQHPELGASETTNTSSSSMRRPPISRLRARQGQGRTAAAEPAMRRAVERFNEATSDITSLLDRPVPRIGSPDISIREYSGEAEVNRRRKRRKLDSDPLFGAGMRGFNYGYRGQVVPGQLKMEMAHCDGGIDSEAARHGREFVPENVLINNKSVYCTGSSQCNLLLRHKAETSFCLKKLVIKAPERNFTAPIQEGMVFISMSSTDLLTRTSQYQMREGSPLDLSPEDSPPLFPEGTTETRPLSRRRNSTSLRTIPPAISNHASRVRHPTTSILHPFTAIDLGDYFPSRNRSITPPPPLGFTITSHCNDPSSDEEEESGPATLLDRHRRDQQTPPYDVSSGEESEDHLERALHARAMGVPSSQLRNRASRRRRDSPRGIECVAAGKGEGMNEDEEGKGPLAPHASFFIEREKSVVSVAFDPPVSGKFILVKLWSPSKDQNIDIQSITAHGFAGPRFFPAMQMM